MTLLGLIVALAGAGAGALWLLRHQRRDWPVVGLLLLLALGFAIAFDGFKPDDSYITYRYAHNLLIGNGFVYNPGERVLSTTTPLYALLLGAVGTLWPDLPVTSHVLNVIALFAGALIMYRFCAECGRAVVGLLLAALYILNPLTVAVYSSESIPHVAFIWGAFYAWNRGPRGWIGAAACAALAVLNRGDGALVAIVLGLAYLATHAWRTVPAEGQGKLAALLRRPETRAIGVYLLLAVPWYAFSWAYFGSPAPATLAAKIAQRGVVGTMTFFQGLGFWWNSYTQSNPLYWLLLPLAIIGLGAVLRRERWAGPITVWAGLYTLGYSFLGVPRYQNYYTPLMPVLLLLGVLGAHWLGVGLRRLVAADPRFAPAAWPAFVPVVTGVLCAGLFVASWNAEVFVQQRLPQPRVVIYEQIGRWLKANTPSAATVGMLEVGTIGYYADRHVIDFYGLIQPDIAQHLAVNDQRWGVIHYAPDYIVGLPNWLGAWQGDPWFQATYAPVYTFPVYQRYSDQPVIMFQRKTP